jgi:tRNA G46 methylase TrmB
MLNDRRRNEAYSSSIRQTFDLKRKERHVAKPNPNPNPAAHETLNSSSTVSLSNDKTLSRSPNNINHSSMIYEERDIWFEIGCGSGLLSCLLAKHSTAHVIAFECVPELARIARETVKRNNLTHQVTVWLVITALLLLLLLLCYQ